MTKFIGRLDHLLQKNHYLVFLTSLLAWICIIPIFVESRFYSILEVSAVSIVLISSIYFFHLGNRKFSAFILTPLTFILVWLDFFALESALLQSISRAAILTVLLFITYHLIVFVIKSKEVDLETIYAAIGGYVMIGIMSAILCWFINRTYPGAYNLAHEARIVDFVYYTIVTMSTLGYGDITPQLEPSRSLAILIVIIGQFYMAILVALLIGKFLSKSKS